MKYLKTFEVSMLDRILDKIQKHGMSSLTPAEDKLLKNYYKGDSKELENIVKNNKNRVYGVFDYDPRNDKEYFDELGSETGINFDFSKYDDDMIQQGRYEIVWDDLPLEDMRHFIKLYKIEDNIEEKPWGKLNKDIQDKFKTYINEIY